jgi:hypothetical protein
MKRYGGETLFVAVFAYFVRWSPLVSEPSSHFSSCKSQKLNALALYCPAVPWFPNASVATESVACTTPVPVKLKDIAPENPFHNGLALGFSKRLT